MFSNAIMSINIKVFTVYKTFDGLFCYDLFALYYIFVIMFSSPLFLIDARRRVT